jgi:predicted transcriptional regulator
LDVKGGQSGIRLKRITCACTRDLRALRGDRLQGDIANKLEITQPAISKIESGDENLTLSTLDSYSKALGFQVCITWKPLP